MFIYSWASLTSLAVDALIRAEAGHCNSLVQSVSLLVVAFGLRVSDLELTDLFEELNLLFEELCGQRAVVDRISLG